MSISKRKQVKVGRAVGGMVAATQLSRQKRPPHPDPRTGKRLGVTYSIPCGHKGCERAATEGEAFRIKTPPRSRHKTKLMWFWRCDKHEHSHWRLIGYRGD